MSPFDPLARILRAVLGEGERAAGDALARSPLHEAAAAEHEVAALAEALHRAADTAERHIDSLDSLAAAVPALTDSVNLLTEQLQGLLHVLAPVAGAERDISRLEHLFHRRHKED